MRQIGTVMKFFTRAWHSGEYDDWSDEEYRAEGPAYRQYVTSISDRLPFEALALSHIDLHVGLFKEFIIDEARQTIHTRIRAGDSSTSNYDVNLDYHSAVITETETGSVSAVMSDPETEVLYDEIDVAGDNAFEHRLLLWPRGIFVVRFKQLHVTQHPVASR
jgi:hypothetical protein